MTRPPAHPARIAATAGVPPHVSSGPLTPAQLQIARARMAGEHVALLAEDLAACPVLVRQAARRHKLGLMRCASSAGVCALGKCSTGSRLLQRLQHA